MNRREFIIKSAFAGAALTSPKIFSFGRVNTKLVLGNPLRFPTELLPGESLVFNSANVEVWPGTTTQILGLNNSYPGPTIRVQKGDNFSVLFENQYSDEATIHWHGLLVPELMDGQPKDAVLPGNNYTYTFPVFQKAGTYFYHSHAHHLTAKHVYKGYAGFFIVEDDDELQYGLPTGNYDIPLLVQDRHSVYQPQFTYSPTMMDRMMGYLGDVPLVNGTPEAFFEVQKTLYRFRLLNGSNARVYKIAFSDNSPFWVIATDGGLKDEPVKMNSLYLAPGERVDILFDFFPYSIGNSVTLQSQAFSGVGNQGTQMDLLRFDVIGDLSSGGTVPQNLAPIDYYNINDIQRTRNFVLSQSGMGSGMHRINGITYDMNRIDEIIPFNELEEWKFINNTNNAYDGCNNTWDNDYPSGGNYWDDYNGTDEDGDGIGDTPYPIPGGDNEDRYPLMNTSGENQPPATPTIKGQTKVKPGVDYDYTFLTTDPEEDSVLYHISWNYRDIIYVYGPFKSGEEFTLSYSWSEEGTYFISCWASDIHGAGSDTASLEITVPRTKTSSYLWFEWLLEHFPMLERLLSLISRI